MCEESTNILRLVLVQCSCAPLVFLIVLALDYENCQNDTYTCTCTQLVILNKGPCLVYCSGRGRHYIGNDVVDESH